jgi:hypothetical protein
MPLYVMRSQEATSRGRPVFKLVCKLELSEAEAYLVHRYGYPDCLEPKDLELWQQILSPSGFVTRSDSPGLARAIEHDTRDFCSTIFSDCLDAQSWDGSESISFT